MKGDMEMAVIVREKVKGSGEWYIFINHQGKRKSKKVGRDKRLALEVAEKIAARLLLGDTKLIENSPPCPTFKEYAEQWLQGYIRSVRRGGTYTRYKCALERQIYPAIGKMNLIQIKRKDIKTLLLELNNRGFSKSSISMARIVISGVMTSAIEDEIIELNPATGMMKQLGLKPEKGFKGETYGHIIPSDNDSAVNLLDDVSTATKRNLYATKKALKVINS